MLQQQEEVGDMIISDDDDFVRLDCIMIYNVCMYVCMYVCALLIHLT